jgi:hypothetical protein
LIHEYVPDYHEISFPYYSTQPEVLVNSVFADLMRWVGAQAHQSDQAGREEERLYDV